MKNEKGGTTMNVSTCLNILREIKDVAFATVDENNQPINSGISVDKNKASEQALNKQLEKSILEMLEPIFGKGKVKATVKRQRRQ